MNNPFKKPENRYGDFLIENALPLTIADMLDSKLDQIVAEITRETKNAKENRYISGLWQKAQASLRKWSNDLDYLIQNEAILRAEWRKAEAERKTLESAKTGTEI